jgi:hypothetical protein
MIAEIKPGPGRVVKPHTEAPAFPRDGATLVLENDRVVVWDVTYPADYALPFHLHSRETLVFGFSEGTFKPGLGQRTLTARKGMYIGKPAGMVDSEMAVGGPIRTIEIEVKR